MFHWEIVLWPKWERVHSFGVRVFSTWKKEQQWPYAMYHNNNNTCTGHKYIVVYISRSYLWHMNIARLYCNLSVFSGTYVSFICKCLKLFMSLWDYACWVQKIRVFVQFYEWPNWFEEHCNELVKLMMLLNVSALSLSLPFWISHWIGCWRADSQQSHIASDKSSDQSLFSREFRCAHSTIQVNQF